MQVSATFLQPFGFRDQNTSCSVFASMVAKMSKKSNKGKFNPFPAPKRGKGRCVLKRPSAMKTKAWKETPYVRHSSKQTAQNIKLDRKMWKRSLPEILRASDKCLVKMLLEDELLSSWAGKTCPRCGKGTLSKLDSGDKPRHRCSYWKCHVYINPQHLHPLFLDSRGSSCVPLQTQAALLFLKINNVPHATIHRVLGINHKAIEDLANRLHALRKKYVEAKEKEIDFGSRVAWGDVEADETTFDRRNLGATAVDKSTPIAWEQWCGLVKRGHPETLVLHRLSPKMSETRAPGPGAIRKVEWTPLGNKWLKNKKIVLHTDAAKSYKCHIPGVVHDNVIHCKKRVKINGKWKWQGPNYVRLVSHKVPGKKTPVRCKAGTQVIDRAWRFLKDRLQINQASRVGSAALRAKLRSAQYEYWHRNRDMWVATGSLCAWEMAKFIPAS